jgi:uncharacterized protein YbaR (Trm112 family)
MIEKNKITPTISSFLLEHLVCPVSKHKLVYDHENQELVCKESGLAYPIQDGVPLLLVEKARKID